MVRHIRSGNSHSAPDVSNSDQTHWLQATPPGSPIPPTRPTDGLPAGIRQNPPRLRCSRGHLATNACSIVVPKKVSPPAIHAHQFTVDERGLLGTQERHQGCDRNRWPACAGSPRVTTGTCFACRVHGPSGPMPAPACPRCKVAAMPNGRTRLPASRSARPAPSRATGWSGSPYRSAVLAPVREVFRTHGGWLGVKTACHMQAGPWRPKTPQPGRCCRLPGMRTPAGTGHQPADRL